MAKRYVVPPSINDERDLLALMDAEGDSVEIRGRVMKIEMLSGFAQRKITRILLRKGGDETRISCKCLAAATLNGYFSIKFLWWFVWRWYCFIRQYREDELTPAVALIKKKVPLTEYLTNTTLWIAMRETMMAMSREEVFLSLQEQSGGKGGKSAKNANGSRGL